MNGEITMVMNKEQAAQTIASVYNALQEVEIKGTKNTRIMSGIYAALEDVVAQYFNAGDELTGDNPAPDEEGGGKNNVQGKKT
jgi:hypothetical protein